MTTDGHILSLESAQNTNERSASPRVDFVINEHFSGANLVLELAAQATTPDVPGGFQSGSITIKGPFVPGSISYQAMEAALKSRARELFIVKAERLGDLLDIDPPDL